MTETTWFKSIEGAQCLFAIDANVKTNGKKLLTNNDTPVVLEYLEDTGGTGAIESLIRSENYNNLIEERSFHLDYVRPVFENTIELPNEFTLFLKVRMLDSTIFLYSESSFFLALTSGSSTSIYNSAWRISHYISPNKVEGGLFNSRLYTAVLKGNISEKNVYLIANGSSEKIPEDSEAFEDVFKENITAIGSSPSSSWKPSAKILAFGLFDKVLTEDDIDVMSSAVDTEFYREIPILEGGMQHYKEYTKTDSRKSFVSDNKFFITYSVSEPENNFLKKFLSFSNISSPLESFDVSPYTKKQSLSIKDYVYEEGVPISTELFLYEIETGVLIETTKSDTKGFFQFENLDPDFSYIVRASDYKNQYSSITKDYLEYVKK